MRNVIDRAQAVRRRFARIRPIGSDASWVDHLDEAAPRVKSDTANNGRRDARYPAPDAWSTRREPGQKRPAGGLVLDHIRRHAHKDATPSRAYWRMGALGTCSAQDSIEVSTGAASSVSLTIRS